MIYEMKKSQTGRKPGGQPGNWNAFKHGFYSRRYKPLELGDLEMLTVDGLEDEIDLLRVIIRRVFEFASDCQDQDLPTWSAALNTLGAAASRLAGLMRTQQIISGGAGGAVDAISEALGEIAHELGFRSPAGD